MAEPKTDALVKSVETLLAEKEAVTSKEKELIEGWIPLENGLPGSGPPMPFRSGEGGHRGAQQTAWAACWYWQESTEAARTRAAAGER